MKWLYRIIGVGALAGAAYWAWNLYNTSTQVETVIRTVTVEEGSFIAKVQSTGTLEPSELVDVGARVTGEIIEFGTDADGNRVDYGSEVKAGQLLARIDDTLVELAIKRYEASVAQSKAQILTAKANIAKSEASISQAKSTRDKAKRDLERAKSLGVGEALSQKDYDQYLSTAENAEAGVESALAGLEASKASLAQAEAQLQSSEAQLESELRNREYTRITTPVDGTIIVRQVNVGQTVVSSMSASTLFLVARDLTKMQIWASVNEVDIARVKAGQRVEYSVDGLPNQRFEGVVNKIRPNATMSSNVVTYIVEVDIENKNRVLRPYMSATLDFIVQDKKDMLLIPDAAFEFTPQEQFIEASALAKIKERQAQGKPESGGPRFAANSGPRKMAAGGAGGMKKKARAVGGHGAGIRGKKRPDGLTPATVWRKVGENQVAPLRVLRGESNGAVSWVRLPEGVELKAGEELVTTLFEREISEKASGSTNPFAPKMPQRNQRSTGQPSGGGQGGGPGGGK